MNAQKLKNAILQEAIEGRLVPQAPNILLRFMPKGMMEEHIVKYGIKL